LVMTGRQRDDTRSARGAEARRARLAEELRANLARRKAQMRARREAATTEGEDRPKADNEPD
jgi:hypothetical protein